jgi:transcriptional regulator with XRE-family HTH domain
MNTIKLQEQISFLRKQKGLTQEQLANALGVTNQSVSKWESGQCCPDIQLLPAIAELFTSIGLEKFANVPFLAGYTPANLPIMLYAYIGVTGLGFCAYFLSMEKTSAAETSLVFFFKPALAPVLALLILGEPIPMNMFIGILLILAGSMVSIYPNLKKALKK